MRATFDREIALTQAGGSESLLAELAGVFRRECPALLAQLRDAIENGDAASVRRIAHTLKGSAGVFGAEPVVEAALRLEQMGKAEQLGDAPEALARLQVEADRLMEALAAEAE
ncbi:Hpt domain-containing protein [Phycisphaerales bacterium AB-hyl4]|uniref:Hpt domain-containing protein n=1 Tax=Natronomicrosphaera hydrolytica TaxID=3242702 RepID=A0ABV4U2W1_9BACT